MVRDTIPRPFWFVLAMVVALVLLVLAIRLGWSPPGAASGPRRPLLALVTEPTPSTPAEDATAASPTAQPKTGLALPPAPTKAATLTPTAASASLSLRPTPAPYVGPAQREDHYWLARPIGPEDNDIVARYYPYGARQDGSYPVHFGVEFVNPLGTPALAVGDGEVVVAGSDQTTVYGARDNFYGTLVVLKLDRTYQEQPIYALYGHLSELRVAVGQRVKTGQTVGLVGMAGVAEGYHLHFEVRLGANNYQSTANPELWLQPRQGCGTLAGVVLDNAGVLVDDEVRLIVQSASGAERYEVTTYPDIGINPDPGWAEDFCLGDLPAGTWSVQTFVRGQLIEDTVTIASGQTTWLELRLSR